MHSFVAKRTLITSLCVLILSMVSWQTSYADTMEGCIKTDEATTCYGEEIVVVGNAPPSSPKIPDLPDGGAPEPDGGTWGEPAPEVQQAPANEHVASALQKVFQDIFDETGKARCRSSYQVLDTAMAKYTDAASRFVIADRELDIAWQDVFLAEYKTYVDYYKDNLLVDRQILDAMTNTMTAKLRKDKFDLVAEKFDEALAAVLAAQPPLDAAADAYDSCLKNPPVLPPADPPESGSVDPAVCSKKPYTPGC